MKGCSIFFPRAVCIYWYDHDHVIYVFESILIIWAWNCCEPLPWAAVSRHCQPMAMGLLQSSCSLQSWKILPFPGPQVVSVYFSVYLCSVTEALQKSNLFIGIQVCTTIP